MAWGVTMQFVDSEVLFDLRRPVAPDSRIIWCVGGNRGIADGMDHRELRPQDG